MSSSEIVVHHLLKSRSERLFWVLEELNVPYSVKAYKRTSEGKAAPELQSIHPLGKSPILVENGKTYVESGHIITHILQTHSTECKTIDETDDFWSHYAEGSLMLFLQMSKVFKEAGGQAPFYARTVVNGFVSGVHDKYLDIEIQKHFTFIESELAKGSSQWFGGKQEPSLADYMMLFPVRAMIADKERSKGINIGPKTKAWLAAVEARPAYQAGLKRQTKEESSAK